MPPLALRATQSGARLPDEVLTIKEVAALLKLGEKTKMLWLNPSDNQGARFNLTAVEAGKTWEEMERDE